MKYLIIGGTGTLGREITSQLLSAYDDTKPEIYCFSRDELKQKDLAREFNNQSLKFILGDVRDKEALMSAMRGMDVVFHVAALKHVELGEVHVKEFIKTNIIGSMNVVECALQCGVKYVVFSSTDKAVDPINVYGNTKAVSERLFLASNGKGTRFSVFRWGNVIGSRGSVIHHFAESLLRDKQVSITDMSMTRFLIPIETAAKFLLTHYRFAKEDDVMIPAMKSCTIIALADAVAQVLGIENFRMVEVGMRAGEKLHEVLVSQHGEDTLTSDQSDHYSTAELMQMIKPIVKPYLERVR